MRGEDHKMQPITGRRRREIQWEKIKRQPITHIYH